MSTAISPTAPILWSWRPDERPTVLSLSPQGASITTHDSFVWAPSSPVAWGGPAGLPRPAVTSIPLRKRRIRTTSVHFRVGAPPPSTFRPPLEPDLDSTAEPPTPLVRRYTRIHAPADVVKLEHRLYYLLQPPLEAIVAAARWRFPRDPFPYQWDGVAFLYPRHSAVLADEMGLGKTMQAITAARLLLRAGEIRNVLLVCPKPLVTNWQREFQMWAPELPVAVIEGGHQKRRWQWRAGQCAVQIANYEVLMRDRATIAGSGAHFDLVILDESQRIKNRGSSTAQAARAISRDRSWALTGTPVENSPQDLVGIFEFVSPGHLNDQMKPSRLGRLASDYILRRTKDRVLAELPPKLFRDAELELTPEQRESYRLAEEEGIWRLTELGEGATIQHVFELVTRLKQICNFDPATGESAKFERLAVDLEEVAASGQKAIVFSQWVHTLQELARRLGGWGTLEFHGRVPGHERDGVIEQFRSDPSKHVLLLSYGAGGVGLNLQFAHYVFLFDRWWNPAIEDQAINRAHRIGVAERVTVTRFLALNTIEERIDQVLRQKREIFDTIFADHDVSRPQCGLTQAEIFGLFRLPAPQASLAPAA